MSRRVSRFLDSCGKDLPTAEEIVNHLRSMSREFERKRQKVLLRKRLKEEEEEDNSGDQGKRKKQRTNKGRSSSSSQDSGGVVSTSEDAVYSEKFDLTNKSLRDHYAKRNTSSEKPIVEIETVTNKDSRKMTTTGLRKEGKVSPSVSGTTTCDVDSEAVEGNNGPTFKDFGGIKTAGVLFHGPPGCGKTRLANAIANEAGVPFYQISATEVVSGVLGASEENIRELFSKAYRTAPSIVFNDEIDAIGSKRESQQREMEKRIVTQLLTGPKKNDTDSSGGHVVVIGATNRLEALDAALRRSGRFDCEIALGIPDEDARAQILSVVVQRLRLEGSFDARKIARLTPGFVGADLEGVANMAGRIGIKRVMDSRKSQLSRGDVVDDRSWLRQPWSEEELEQLFVRMSDFEEAVKLVQGSLTREGFSTVPNVTWDHVGGLEHLRRELNSFIVRPIKYPDTYEAFKADLETGFLLYGPPGCGKTLIAKAVAKEAGANFIHIKVDAMTTSRGREGRFVVEGVLNQFLAELNRGENRNVYVIGVTNRPDVIDPAFLRHGRFGNLVYVPLPNADERASILKAIGKKKPVDPSVDLDAIARINCEGFSGADLASLVDKAIHVAIEEKFSSIESSEGDGAIDLSGDCTIKVTHFQQAVTLVSPSVSKQQIKHYEELREELQRRGLAVEGTTTNKSP
ncbi:hypothetical protein Bca52824_040503 [Brassica carinata]|uniref:AAA+ ATPase domain-containing protein n=1 Tax=Brassica carinata TaxID=52824 RepID=A0A8X7UWZ6_BRACI|nr:hypothetical protein Bca52824_040503 [Brassica carinata]